MDTSDIPGEPFGRTERCEESFKMPGMVEEEWIKVGDEISLIKSLFGLTDFLLEMRRLITMTRRMMRAMPVMQPDMM